MTRRAQPNRHGEPVWWTQPHAPPSEFETIGDSDTDNYASLVGDVVEIDDLRLRPSSRI